MKATIRKALTVLFFAFSTASCFAAEIVVDVVAKNPSASPDSDFADGTVLITLTGKIGEGDDKEFQSKIKGFLKATSSDSDNRGNIVLRLQNSIGGKLPPALGIAKIIREERITTFVPKGTQCVSACAMIFLAGRRSINFMPIRTERILEVGATVSFHGPYEEDELDQPGMLGEGVSIVREIMSVLGDALPDQLLIETSPLAPSEGKVIDSIYDAARWDIQLIGYKKPRAGRESLLNACINDASWQHKRPIGIVEGIDLRKQTSSFLTNAFGKTVFDLKKNAIRASDYVLPSEGAELASLRKSEGAPDLLRDFRTKDGTYASQFAFGYGDEPAAFWCTAVKSPRRRGVEIYPRRLSIATLLRSKTNGQYGEAWSVPDWFQYPPGMKLIEIVE
jgi:hypothetical protein